MNFKDARDIFNREILAKNSELALIEGDNPEYKDCFVFYYQSKKYIETEKLSDMMVGHGPVIVCKMTGRVFETGSAHPSEHYIEVFEACGNPLAERTSTVEVVGSNIDAKKVSASKLIKALSGLGLKEAKAIVDSALKGEPGRFETNSPQSADEAARQLSKYGFIAAQLWSNQC